MTDNQFNEIKNRAWNWYKNGMRSWSLATIKDFDNAPQWAKDAVCYYQGNAKIDFVFVIDCDDVNLLKKYDAQIDAMLRVSQRLNFEVNFIKELLEFAEAKRDRDDYEMIDALCDMIIIALNAGAYKGHSHKEYTNENLVAPLTVNYVEISGLLFELERRGYDPYKCLLETVKELETRSGSWNEEEGKWCKDVGAYTLNEAIEKAEDEEECGFALSLCLLKEDNDFWLIGDDDEDFDEEQSLDEIKHEFLGHCVKVKKWYKADYSGCKQPF